MKKFILLTTPRSGSTWLDTLLNDHTDISMFGELFLPYDVPKKYQELRKNDPEKFFRFRAKHKARRPKITNAYLDYVFAQSEKTVGFKLMAYPFISHPEVILYCRKNNIHLIHLTRDTQQRVISYAIAEKRDNFHSLSEEDDQNTDTIRLDPYRVKKLYKKQKLLSATLNTLVKNISCPYLSIDYQDLIENQDEKLKEIYEFLSVSPHTPISELKKTSVIPYEDMVENYQAIERVFKKQRKA